MGMDDRFNRSWKWCCGTGIPRSLSPGSWKLHVNKLLAMMIVRRSLASLIVGFYGLSAIGCAGPGVLSNNLTVVGMDAPAEKLQSVMADDLERSGYTLTGRYVADRRYITGKESVLLFYRPARGGKEEQHVALSFTGSSLRVECFSPVYNGFADNPSWQWNRCNVVIVNTPLSYGGWNQRAKKIKTTRWKEGYSAWKETGDIDDLQYPLGTYSRAVVYENQGNSGEAASLYKKVLKEYEQQFPPSDVELLMLLNHLARSLRNTSHLSEAKQYYTRALQGWQTRGSATEPGYIGALNGIAMLLWKEGMHDESRTYFSKALSAVEQAYGLRSKATFHYIGCLTYWYEEAAALVDVEALKLRNISLLQAMGKDKDVAGTAYSLADTYYIWGREEQADRFYHYALDLMEKSHDERLPRYLDWYQTRKSMLERRVMKTRQTLESR